jgi:hypothetical protein
MEYKIVLIQDVKIVIMLGFLSMICIFEYSVIRLYNERKRTLIYMREKKVQLYVDSQERSILLHSLVELKNQLIQQGRYTDCVDELIFKVVNAPVKRVKIEYV